MSKTRICDYCSIPYEPKFSNGRAKHHYCSKLCKDTHHSILYGSGLTKDEYQKRYYLENREKKLSLAKARYALFTEEKREYDKKRRKECAERLSNERREKYKQNKCLEQVKTAMLNAARTRAKKQGVVFSITRDDIVIPEFCPALGIRLDWNKGKALDNSMSLDKIIPRLGYIKGNVAVISKRANQIKHNASLDEIQKISAWLMAAVSF